MKNNFKWKALGLFVIGYFALFFLTDSNETDVAEQNQNTSAAQVNSEELPMAPVFTLKDVNGNLVSLEDYRGKIVFVNIWATWCGPCRMEIPHFVRLINKYQDQGFAILGVSIDDQRDIPGIPQFMDQYSMNYPVLLDPQQEVPVMYGGISGVPTTYVLDREGRALGRIVGMRSYEQFEGILKQIL